MIANPMLATPSKRGADDAGRYFRYMAEFVGFDERDAQVIQQTGALIDKHLPAIVSKFYDHLLRYPPTRKFFLKKDGSLDQDYIELRMRHLTNFWLRTAKGVFDDDYASYVDYVGRAHTAHGADPSVYIPERYVIGQVGMMQHAISEALSLELRDVDDELEFRAVEAWDKLMMVILELLARAYGNEREAETFQPLVAVDAGLVARLAAEAVNYELGQTEAVPLKEVAVAEATAIPDGGRKIVQVEGLSIGVFHHKGGWYALRNSCVHRGGPVATGSLVEDTLYCPWHGFPFDVTSGQCLLDPSARLETYAVTEREGQVYLQVPVTEPAKPASAAPPAASAAPLYPNQFRLADIPAGQIRRLEVDGEDVAVFNVGGRFYATHDACTHADGPLSESDLDGKVVTCFLHGSQFDVTTGAVLAGPAFQPLRVFQVVIEGEIGSVVS